MGGRFHAIENMGEKQAHEGVWRLLGRAKDFPVFLSCDCLRNGPFNESQIPHLGIRMRTGRSLRKHKLLRRVVELLSQPVDNAS